MESATIDFFSNFHFRNFLVRDQHNDTLLFTPELTIVPNSFTITSRFVEISKIRMERPKINLKIDSTNTINLQFIVSKLASKDSTKAGWLIAFQNIVINQGHLTLKHALGIHKENVVNFTDLDLTHLNINVSGFKNTGNGVEIKIKDLNTIDKSGFIINKLKTRLILNRNNLVFNNLELKTPNSFIDADQIWLNFSKWKDLSAAGIFKKVKINVDCNESSLSTNDLCYFIPLLKEYNLTLGISGKMKGTINDLKGKNLKITYGNNTVINGNIDINGLPDIKNAFMHIDIKSLATNPSDIRRIYLPFLKYKHLLLPNNFNKVAYLKYKGKFTGFISDFVAYGTLTSNLGAIDADISLKPDTAQSFTFNGIVKMKQFQLGKYLSKEDKIGPISLNVLAKGKVTKAKEFFMSIDGQVSSFIFNKYNYQNIKIDGKLTNKTFDGNLSINDVNVELGFKGNVDFTNPAPVFNFIANVKNANLYKLHLDEKDTSSSASFYATAKFEGNNIDNIKGEIKLWNSTFKKTGKEVHINDFLLFTQNVNDTNRLILRSTLADAEIWGQYKFKELGASFKALAKIYFPSLISGAVSDSAKSNNFRFEVDFKDTKQLTDFIIPDLYISKDSKLIGNYNAKRNDLNFLLKVPLLQHKTRKWYNVYFNGKATRDSFSLVSGCNNLKLTNQLNLQNFSIVSNFKNDSMNIAVRWNNWDTVTYKGNLSISGSISKKTSNGKQFHFIVNPSTLVLKDTLWNLTASSIGINSTGISINQFQLSHNNQKLVANGKISNQKDDHIIVEFENLNLGNLKTIYSPKKLAFDGILNGKAQFSDIFTTTPYFFALLTVDSLSINNQVIGVTHVKANWDNTDKSIFIDADSYRGNLQTLKTEGHIFVKSRSLDFDVHLLKLKIDLFEPFISGIFSNVHGIASGDLKLTGSLSAPLLNGEINAQKVTLMVNYLKTRYNFTQSIPIKNNTFIFKNTEIYDNSSNKAYVNGTIEFEKFRDLHVDLKIDASNFQCLNTTEKDNSLYYGIGYASGAITIKGTAPIIQMDITATTKRNTTIFIPLLSKSDLLESNFIRIVKKAKVEDPFVKYEIDKSENKIDISAINSGLKLNLNLNVTPEADVQIIFDEKIGGYIQGNGNGNFNISLDGGRFNMFGLYTIEDGKYYFSLQNIIKKKFEVNPGGTISWNGDPLDAVVNIEAQYRAKAALYELLGGTNDQYKKRIPIDCQFWITDKLMNPNIRYDIYLPNSDQNTRNLVENAINSDEERSKQFLSLLVLNSFYMPNPEKTQQSNTGINAAGVTGIEFLSNQFSHWLSQISNDFDIGVNYHTGDEITNQEVEVALSTQLLNDRITLNGNVDVGVDQKNSTTGDKTNNIVGDFNLEYKFTDNGKLRLKVFNRSNESYFDKLSSPYTQGVGIFYKEEFNTFHELMNKYYKTIFIRKKNIKVPSKEEKQVETKDSTNIVSAKTNVKK